jgi:hypothetical protein
MWSRRYVLQVDRIEALAISDRADASVVSKAVLDAYNNPGGRSAGKTHRSAFGVAHHKFVNTTPKPRATKNSRGELVGPPGVLVLLLLVAMLGVGNAAVICEIGEEGVGVSLGFRFLPMTLTASATT